MKGKELETRKVVTSFLEHEGKILVLRRSQKVGTYRGRWAGVSGYIEEGVDPLEQALREIEEETGLSRGDVELVRRGEPLEIADEELGRRWIVHPFRFWVRDPRKIKIDWEHVELRWISPEELRNLETVPALPETWERVV